MFPFPFTPAQLALVDQLEGDTAAIIRVSVGSEVDIKGLRISRARLAGILRQVADQLDDMDRHPEAAEEARHEGH